MTDIGLWTPVGFVRMEQDKGVKYASNLGSRTKEIFAGNNAKAVATLIQLRSGNLKVDNAPSIPIIDEHIELLKAGIKILGYDLAAKLAEGQKMYDMDDYSGRSSLVWSIFTGPT